MSLCWQWGSRQTWWDDTHLSGEQETIRSVLGLHVQLRAMEHRGGAGAARPAGVYICEAGEMMRVEGSGVQ